MRCPISNLTSVEIDAFEFENLNMKKMKKKKRKKRDVSSEQEDEISDHDVVLYRIHNKPHLHFNTSTHFRSAVDRPKRSIDNAREGRVYRGDNDVRGRVYQNKNDDRGHVYQNKNDDRGHVYQDKNADRGHVYQNKNDDRGHIYRGKTMKEKILASLTSSKEDEVETIPSRYFKSRRSNYGQHPSSPRG